MINLDVAEYCHDCDAFEPITIKLSSFNNTDICIRCVNHRKCFNIQRYLTKEIEKKYGRERENNGVCSSDG